MDSITIKHIIEENKITISFDLADGSLSFPSVELGIVGDIDLNLLVVKLAELIEKKRKLNVDFEDSNSLIDSNPKIKLIKNTLEEIYSKFNSQFEEAENNSQGNQVGFIEDDDLPF